MPLRVFVQRKVSVVPQNLQLCVGFGGIGRNIRQKLLIKRLRFAVDQLHGFFAQRAFFTQDGVNLFNLFIKCFFFQGIHVFKLLFLKLHFALVLQLCKLVARLVQFLVELVAPLERLWIVAHAQRAQLLLNGCDLVCFFFQALFIIVQLFFRMQVFFQQVNLFPDRLFFFFQLLLLGFVLLFLHFHRQVNQALNRLLVFLISGLHVLQRLLFVFQRGFGLLQCGLFCFQRTFLRLQRLPVRIGCLCAAQAQACVGFNALGSFVKQRQHALYFAVNLVCRLCYIAALRLLFLQCCKVQAVFAFGDLVCFGFQVFCCRGFVFQRV